MRRFIFLCLIICSYQASFSQVFDVDSILFSGTKASRINLVILSDGYTKEELPLFIQDAKNFAKLLLEESPYKEYKNYFNIFAIKTPSNESGASHPGTARDEPAGHAHPVIEVDNYFGSHFDAGGMHRLLAAKSLPISQVLASNIPDYDIAVLLVNSPYYGGSGSIYAVASTHPSAAHIAIHEIGHTFYALLDEYYAGDAFAREGANMTQETDPKKVKWKNWIGEEGIGIYQHDWYGTSKPWYRPHENCKMRYLDGHFCAVCKQAMVEKFHSTVSPISSFSPDTSTTIPLSSTMDFQIDLIETIPNTITTEWSINGKSYQKGGDQISLSSKDMSEHKNKVQVTVYDNTDLLRIDNHETIYYKTIIWQLTDNTMDVEKVVQDAFKVNLYPIPVQDILFVKLSDTTSRSYTMTLSSISGRILQQTSNQNANQPTTINLSQLPKGVYLLHFTLDNGVAVTKKITKQ